ncbi:NAD(P)/FAD-dependent oxidoreductase [Candidatus Margulisiibacteriota bacterium]
MEKVAVTIIGAGVVGLAIAAELAKTNDSVFVLEKEDTYGTGASSRNSEVVHAGIYYPPGSLKALLCIEGNRMLVELCQNNNISYKKTGKYIVATSDDELLALENLWQNAKDCGLETLVYKTEAALKKVEPQVSARGALYSPSTAVINAHELMDYLYQRSRESGVEYAFGVEPLSIEETLDGYLVQIQDADNEVFEFVSEIVINAAGLSADEIAEMAGIDIDKAGYRLHYCKGDYFIVHGEQRKLIKHLVYPVPQPKIKGLGIHVTLDVAGNMHLGPDAEYISRDDLAYDVSDSKRQDFLSSVNKFFPALDIASIAPERSGIRPKLQGPGDEVRDFVIREEADKGLPGFINLIGIESPGLTASLAIAKYVEGLLS